MNIPFLDLKTQYHNLKSEIDAAIQDILENTAFVGGVQVKTFKEQFAKLYGAEHCIPCANGTDALYIGMKMMGIGAGDEVITTASSWISTSETITQTGAKPVFVDIDEYYTIDPAKIEAAITPNTKAIIPVHLYGQMADMPAIMEIAKKHNLRVIEDCAQSHFSEIDGKRAGLYGDVGTFSFYPGKNLGAYGDAGCMIMNDAELAEKCTMYANHGALKKHHHLMEGINSRLDGLQAAVLNVKLPHIIKWTEQRIAVAEKYYEGLKDIAEVKLPKKRENTLHSYHVFGVKVPNREALKDYLAEQGVPTQIHYPKAMPFMPAYSHLEAKVEDYPNAYDLQEHELSLPIFPEMTDEQVEFVVSQIAQFFQV